MNQHKGLDGSAEKKIFVHGSGQKAASWKKTISYMTDGEAIRCPALVICGRKDRVNMESALFLSRQMKHAELEIMDNTGHVVNEENPRELARILTKYYAAAAADMLVG